MNRCLIPTRRVYVLGLFNFSCPGTWKEFMEKQPRDLLAELPEVLLVLEGRSQGDWRVRFLFDAPVSQETFQRLGRRVIESGYGCFYTVGNWQPKPPFYQLLR